MMLWSLLEYTNTSTCFSSKRETLKLNGHLLFMVFTFLFLNIIPSFGFFHTVSGVAWWQPYSTEDGLPSQQPVRHHLPRGKEMTYGIQQLGSVSLFLETCKTWNKSIRCGSWTDFSSPNGSFYPQGQSLLWEFLRKVLLYIGISLSKAGPFHLTVLCGLNNSSYSKWSKNQHKVWNKEKYLTV